MYLGISQSFFSTTYDDSRDPLWKNGTKKRLFDFPLLLSSLQSNTPPFPLPSLTPSPPSLRHSSLKSKAHIHIFLQRRKRSTAFTCQSTNDGYLLDAPVSAGDGFFFSGGKYSDGPNPAHEWFKTGRYMKADPVYGTGEKAKDPIFGLTMGGNSQTSKDLFRWFCVESGNADKPTVALIHGFPSQAYSYRKVLPQLFKDCHTIAFDWLGKSTHWTKFQGFGYSDKPQPKYGFDYTLDEFVSALGSVIDELGVDKVSLVVQGYFAPIVVKYASNHQEKLNDLILLNPPVRIFLTFDLGLFFLFLSKSCFGKVAELVSPL
ncbi:hypothetical protein LXL04_018991 [Taraxacum kok-saghyz]